MRQALTVRWKAVRSHNVFRVLSPVLALYWNIVRSHHVFRGLSRVLTVCWNIVRSRNVFRGLARSRETIEEAHWSHACLKGVAMCGIALKWMALSLGLLVACLIGALFIIDVDQYRDLVQSRSEDVLGRQLTIAGDIELEWSMSPTLAVHDVALANVPGASRPEMARIGTLAFGLELLPLLRGELRISHLTIIDADLILESGEQGVGNWVFSSGGEPAEGDVGTIPFLQTLELRNSRLTYGGLLNQRRVVEIDEAILTADSPDSEIKLDVSGAVHGVKVRGTAHAGSVASLMARSADWPVSVAGRIGTNRIALEGTIGDPWLFSGYRLRTDATISSLATLRALGGEPVGEDSAPMLPTIHASAVLTGTRDRLSVSEFVATMGRSDVAGEFQVTTGENRAGLTGTLAANTIVLSDFEDGTEADNQPTNLPVDLIQATDADLELTIARFVADELDIQEISAELRVQNGQLNLDISKAVVWDGWWGGRIVADSQLSPLAVGVDITVGQIDLEAMLGHWGLENAIFGQLDGALTLHGRGDTVEALLETANGRIALDIGQGQINNAYTELVGRSLLTALLPDGSEAITEVNCAVGHFDVAEGVARSSALLVDTTRVTVGGEGAIDFGGERLDFLLNPRTKDINLLALVAPTRINGPFGDIEVSLMTGDLVIDAATSVLLGVVNPLAIVIPFVTTGTGGENPCLEAIVSQELMTPQSAPERMIGGAVSVVEGFAEGVGEAAEDLGAGISGVINGIFGQ